MRLRVRPITFKAACEYIDAHHRHHLPARGCKFALAAVSVDRIVGVAVAGRPVARGLDNGLTLEVTRVCTDGTANACSFLYAAVRRVGQAMGYERIVSYIDAAEPGTSLFAAGFEKDGEVAGRSWTCPSRPRSDVNPTTDKQRFVWPPQRRAGAA